MKKTKKIILTSISAMALSLSFVGYSTPNVKAAEFETPPITTFANVNIDGVSTSYYWDSSIGAYVIGPIFKTFKGSELNNSGVNTLLKTAKNAAISKYGSISNSKTYYFRYNIHVSQVHLWSTKGSIKNMICYSISG